MTMLQKLTNLERLNIIIAERWTDAELILLASSLTNLKHLKVDLLPIPFYSRLQSYLEINVHITCCE